MMTRRLCGGRLRRTLTLPILFCLLLAAQACVRSSATLPSVDPVALASTGLVLGPTDDIVRVGILNTKMLPFTSAGRRAEVIGARILAGDFAIVALSEVFSETGRERLVELLEAAYPYRVEYLGSRKLHRLDSGLMLLSRFPLSEIADSVPFRTLRVRASTDAGSEPEQAAAFVRFVEFDDCARNDCWAGKGVGYVRADVSGRPLHLFFTHMQASYGSDDAEGERETAGVRSSQRAQVAGFVRSVAGDGLRHGESALIVGDLNVDGSADLTGGISHRTALLGDERLEMLSQLSGPFPSGLSDTWRDHAPAGDPGLTFPVRSLHVRFDYVLASLPDSHGGLCVRSVSRAFGLDTRRTPDSIDITAEREVTDHVGLVVDLGSRADGCASLASADAEQAVGAR